MMKNALVLGGTHDHISLLEILRNKGYYTILIDYLELPPAAKYADEFIRESTIDKERILTVAVNKKVDLVISTCIDSALTTVAYVSEKLKLPCHISYSTALALTNKSLMKEVFVNNNIPTSKFITVKSDLCIDSNKLSYPVVVKPVDANSSKGVNKVNNYEELQVALNEAYRTSLSKNVIVEEYKKGKEISVDVLVIKGQVHILLISENIKSILHKGKFTIIQSKFPVKMDESIYQKIVKVSENISLAYNITDSPLLIQMILDEEDIFVIEFSARIGGGSKHHFIRHLCDFNFLDAFVSIILNESIEIPSCSIKYKFACINFLYGHNGSIEKFEGFEELKNEGVVLDYFQYKSYGMLISGNTTSSDRPAGYLIYGTSEEELIQKSAIVNNRIKVCDNTGRNLLMKFE